MTDSFKWKYLSLLFNNYSGKPRLLRLIGGSFELRARLYIDENILMQNDVYLNKIYRRLSYRLNY